MTTRLVINGCSYAKVYVNGRGHQELATKLNIQNATSLAINGSCNSRIIRTTLKDSYLTDQPTLYIVGLTFLGRTELPLSTINNSFEGKWTSIQNKFDSLQRFEKHWTQQDCEQYINLKLKSEVFSIEDRLEQLTYQLLSMIGDLTSRGHKVVVFKNPEDIYDQSLNDEKFTNLKKCVNIIDGLSWAAIPWQVTQGVVFEQEDSHLPSGVRHPLPGEHGPLNDFLFEYITQNKIK